MGNFSTTDSVIFFGYILMVMGFGIWLSRKKGGTDSTQDYFLAGKALPWWAIGGSLIASNISTEQILAMNGSGYVMGMAIATYELMAAFTLIIVAKYFLPVFIKKGIYTMPQFLEERYDSRVRTIMAFFWVILFIFVNVTSVLYLGGLAIQSILGVPLLIGVLGLVLYSASFSIFGGLKAVVWTDVIQVVVLVFGGLLASYLVVTSMSGGGYIDGLKLLVEKAPDKFDMILDRDNPSFGDLPGITVLIGGMWIANLYYWGNNQYIIQRALAAKSIPEAQKGVVFAAALKLLMPLIVVIPGICAFLILKDPAAYGFTGEGFTKPDQAFPWVLNNFVGSGFKGLVFAALVAAIGSSISSMTNSASTIFTLDIYKPLIAKGKSEKHLVNVGKLTSAIVLAIGLLMAPFLASLDQVFQYIQEYTGFISPGVLAVFIFGMFWRRATANAAFVVVLAAIPLSVALKFGVPDLPFLDRMSLTFLLCCALLVLVSIFELKAKGDNSKDMSYRIGLMIAVFVISTFSGFKILMDEFIPNIFGYLIILLSIVLFGLLIGENKVDDKKAIHLESGFFGTSMIFNLASFGILAVLAVIYTIFW